MAQITKTGSETHSRGPELLAMQAPLRRLRGVVPMIGVLFFEDAEALDEADRNAFEFICEGISRDVEELERLWNLCRVRERECEPAAETSNVVDLWPDDDGAA